VKVVLGLFAFLVLGVAGTGCDVSPPAATVNGSTISQSQLDSVLSAVVGNKDQYVACALQLQGTNLPSSLAGAGGSTVSSDLASYELSTLVLDELVSQDLARHHHSVTSDAISKAATDLETEFGLSASSASSSGSQSCLGQLSGRQLLLHLPSSFSSEQVRYLADQEQLAVAVAHVDLSTASIEHYYFAHASEFAETCISDIEVTTQAQAQSILGTITSGAASFATEAQQLSLDTQTAPNGGVVSPCFSSSQLQSSTVLSSVSTLSAGQVSQPIQVTASTGSAVWLLLQVDSKPEVPLSQATSQIRLALLSAGSSTLSREFDRLSSRAKVSVDPRYGTWNHLRGVQAPVPPPAKYLLSPAADQPGSSSALGG